MIKIQEMKIEKANEKENKAIKWLKWRFVYIDDYFHVCCV